MSDYSPNKARDAAVESAEAELEWYRTMAESAISIQQQNVEFVKNPFWNAPSVFDAYARASREMVRATAQASERQQKALQALYEEQGRAYESMFSSFYDPFSFLRSATEAWQGAVGEGVQAVQQATGGTLSNLRDGAGMFQEGAQAGVEVTEAAQQMAEETGVDISRVKGTGAGGKIIVSDVVEAAENSR